MFCYWCRMESAVLKLLQLEKEIDAKEAEVKAASEASCHAVKQAMKAKAVYGNPRRPRHPEKCSKLRARFHMLEEESQRRGQKRKDREGELMELKMQRREVMSCLGERPWCLPQ